MTDADRTTIALRLRHVVTTMVNDDHSEPSTPQRARLMQRIQELTDVVEMLRDAPDETAP